MDKKLNIFNEAEVDLNVNGGPTNIQGLLSSYDCVILKPNKKGSKNVLEQWMVASAHTKYIIKYDFDLEDTIIEMPDNAILEIDCGSLQHGTLVGNNTVLLNINGVDNALVNITLEGTWEKSDLEETVEEHSETLSNLKEVAFSGSYNDLTNKPQIPSITGDIQYISNGETRPTDAIVGQCFFDTTLGENGKPIWYASGGAWVDATGASV